MQNDNSKLKILKYPDPILKKRCEKIKEITPEIRELALDMTETLTKNQGAGLAAPQVGVLKRIIVVQLGEGTKAFVNPEIIKKTKEAEIFEEGCLSFPGVYLKIKRAKGVEIKAIDLDGKEIQIKTKGLVARIFQHEIDHLDGVLFVDRIPFWRRWRIKKNFPLNYPMG